MRELILEYAILNAHTHGKANSKAVLSKVLGERPDLRPMARIVLQEVEEIVKDVNTLSPEEIKSRVVVREKDLSGAEKGLTPLKNAVEGNVVLRFAPNPSGPLHLGHARAALLNDEYSKLYKGHLILRFEDTDPKRVDTEAFDMILKDLDWLGVKVDKVIHQSKRLHIYYDHARMLVEKGLAYICRCDPPSFKALRDRGAACPCRARSDGSVEFERMFTEYKEGEAVLRLKTDLAHKNTSFRDFPLLRIVEKPHPIAGDKRVYPLMNLSVAVDDHLLGLTHVLRGKDHILNTHKQALLYDAFGWAPPEYLHYGLLKIEGVMLSTSEIKKGIDEGRYSGWSDPSLGTLSALAMRGIQPEAVRRLMLDVGAKQTDISFSWKNLYAYNKELIDPLANRYSVVIDPRPLHITGAPDHTARNALHPSFDRGFRITELSGDETTIYLSGEDYESLEPGMIVRLMGAYNILIEEGSEGVRARFHSLDLEKAREARARLLNWVSPKGYVEVVVYTPDGVIKGFGEEALTHVGVGDIVQFERFAFTRMTGRNKAFTFYFTHK